MRRHQLLLLLLLLGIPIRAVWAQPKPFTITKGPYRWVSGFGGYPAMNVQVTVTVSSDPKTFPGLYLWHYRVQPDPSFACRPPQDQGGNPGPPGGVNFRAAPLPRSASGPVRPRLAGRAMQPLDEEYSGGLDGEYFQVYLPGDTRDMGNESPANLYPSTLPDDGSVVGFGFTQDCQGTSAFEFQFTTKPRAVVELGPCNSAGDGNIDLYTWDRYCGRYYATRDLPGDCTTTVYPGDCHNLTSTGRLAVPGPQVRLKSFKWDAVDSGSWVGLQPFWKTNDNWQDDQLADEGTQPITHPKWADSNGDSEPERSDPVAYRGPAKPVLTEATLKQGGSGPADAVLRVTSADSSGTAVPSLVFQDVQVHFAGGKATMDSVVSQQAFPTEIQNIDVTLTWSISFDGGQTFTDFATTQHKIFVTIGTARGFDGKEQLPPRPNVTAARLNKATGDLNGVTNRKAAAARECSRVNAQVRPGGNNLWNPGPGWQEVYSNPWAVLDSGLTGFDCVSLALLAAVQVRQVGIDADVSMGYPTSDGNASTPEYKRFLQTAKRPSWIEAPLDFLAGDSWNRYEGYLLARKQGQAVDAFTAYPVAGPIPPYTGRPVPGLPPDPEGRLDFAVIYETLRSLVATAGSGSMSGQQWWVLDYRTVKGGPVPFPLPLQ